LSAQLDDIGDGKVRADMQALAPVRHADQVEPVELRERDRLESGF
jgi:hypothetical protein